MGIVWCLSVHCSLSSSHSSTTMSLTRVASTYSSRLLSQSMTGCVSIPPLRSLSVSVSRPGDRYFTKKHEWVLVEGSKGTVGVSKYAADALGDVVYAQLPEPGDTVTAGEECGALESVKAASEIFSPVTGTVIEKNDKVEDGPALINQSPMEEGWLFRVEMVDPDQVTGLMDKENYENYLKQCEDL